MRRRTVPFACLVLLGCWSSTALGQVPTLPVPLPPPPPLPVPLPVPLPPPAPAPVQLPPPPPTPVQPPSTPDVTGAVGSAAGGVTGGAIAGGSAGGSAPSAPGGGGSAGSSAGSAATAAPPDRPVRAAQPAIRNVGERDERRAAVLTFSLSRAAVVRFRVRQEAPGCVVVGSFNVRGQVGHNRIRFAGRFRGVPLPAGTYTLRGTAFRNGRAIPLGAVTVVVVPPGTPAAGARRPSTCDGPSDGVDEAAAAQILAAGTALAQSDGGDGGAAAESGKSASDVASASASVTRTDSGGDGEEEGASEAAGGVAGDNGEGEAQPLLGVPNPFQDAPSWLQPLLLAALGSAVLLLLLAALPATAVRPAGAAPVVVRRRTEFALAGAMILGAVAVAALIV